MLRKNLRLGVLVVLVAYAIYLLYIFVLAPKTNLQPIYLIPKDAVFIIESDKPVESWNVISESEAWSHLIDNDYFSNLTENIQRIDTLFNERKSLFEFFDNRSFYISVHMTTPDDYGLFYVLDLKRIANLNLLKSYFDTLLNEDYSLSRRTYHDHEILEVFNSKEKETLYLSFIKNQLIASYTHTLIESAIDQYKEPEIGRNLNFLAVNKKVGYENLFRLYVQYQYFDDYLNQYYVQPSTWGQRVSENLDFSGFQIDVNSESKLTAEGYTNIKSINEIYLKALQKSGVSERYLSAIAPDDTALYLSYGFSSFEEFFANLENLQKASPKQFESYANGIESLEKFLRINIKEDFVSWIGTEISILQLPTNTKKVKNPLALVLQTKDKNLAKEKLAFVLAQIKKRTPVKFKAVTYNGYEINFLSIKGFFKAILGNRFEEFDKPYFIILEDNVVFSDNPNTLKHIIDKYLAKKTLAESSTYQEFAKDFSSESSLFVYANVPLLFNGFYETTTLDTKNKLRKNKDYFICFPLAGFQLMPDEAEFKSRLILSYLDVNEVKQHPFFKNEPIVKRKQPISKLSSNIDESVFEIPPIYPPDLNQKEYVVRYSNGELKYKVALKDGKKHGRYQNFYPNGQLKIKGRYKEDVQSNTWRYFDQEGTLLLKKRF